jgi:putative exporter of polyketide antibiotics
MLLLGLFASFIYVDDLGGRGDIMFLWQGCMSILIAVFVVLPTRKVIREVTEPVTAPEDTSCVRRSRILLWAFAVNFVVIALYTLLAYLGWNPIQTALHKQVVKEDKLQADARLAYAFGGLVLQDLPSVWAILGVYWLHQRDRDPLTIPHDTQDSLDVPVR